MGGRRADPRRPGGGGAGDRLRRRRDQPARACGGGSPPILVDASAEGLATIHVSGGRRGLQLELAPADLVRLTGAAGGADRRRA